MSIPYAVIFPRRSPVSRATWLMTVRRRDGCLEFHGGAPDQIGPLRQWRMLSNDAGMAEMRPGVRDLAAYADQEDSATAYIPMPRLYARMRQIARPQLSAAEIVPQVTDGWAGIAPSFQITTPPEERKRPIGTRYLPEEHRQARLAKFARSSATQTKSSAMPPLVDCEREPGETLRLLLEMPHPFAAEPPLDDR